MKKDFYLMRIGMDTFIMLNPDKELTNRMCNPNIFRFKEDATRDICVFKYFGIKTHYVCGLTKLDRRTKRFKRLEMIYPYFSAAFLPGIKERQIKGFSTISTKDFFKI